MENRRNFIDAGFSNNKTFNNMNPNMKSDFIYEFERMLSKLANFPDKDLIEEITKFTDQSSTVASDIVASIFSRLCNRSLDIHFKLPTFYLMDAIMKQANISGRGGYKELIVQHLGNVYTHLFEEVFLFKLKKFSIIKRC